MSEAKPKKPTGTKRKTKEVNKEADDKKSKSKPKKSTPKEAEKKITKKEDKVEKAKEQNAPKRAWPAFFFFQKETMPKVKLENPELPQKELVKVSSRF